MESIEMSELFPDLTLSSPRNSLDNYPSELLAGYEWRVYPEGVYEQSLAWSLNCWNHCLKIGQLVGSSESSIQAALVALILECQMDYEKVWGKLFVAELVYAPQCGNPETH